MRVFEILLRVNGFTYLVLVYADKRESAIQKAIDRVKQGLKPEVLQVVECEFCKI